MKAVVGAVGVEKGRLDFDLPDTALDKDAIEMALNELVAADHPLNARWITDEELAANPQLVRTMSVLLKFKKSAARR